jgi:hypothetical protein
VLNIIGFIRASYVRMNRRRAQRTIWRNVLDPHSAPFADGNAVQHLSRIDEFDRGDHYGSASDPLQIRSGFPLHIRQQPQQVQPRPAPSLYLGKTPRDRQTTCRTRPASALSGHRLRFGTQPRVSRSKLTWRWSRGGRHRVMTCRPRSHLAAVVLATGLTEHQISEMARKSGLPGMQQRAPAIDRQLTVRQHHLVRHLVRRKIFLAQSTSLPPSVGLVLPVTGNAKVPYQTGARRRYRSNRVDRA